jgi:hypothetical protein
VSTGVPLWIVVVEIVYVPAQTEFGMMKGNVIEFDAPALMVKVGVVNMTVLSLLQLRPSGPLNVNFTLTFCAVGMQSVTLAVTPTRAGFFTLFGLTLSAA